MLKQYLNAETAEDAEKKASFIIAVKLLGKIVCDGIPGIKN